MRTNLTSDSFQCYWHDKDIQLETFYMTQWMRFYHDLGCYLIWNNNGASDNTGVLNCGWLHWHVVESILIDWWPLFVLKWLDLSAGQCWWTKDFFLWRMMWFFWTIQYIHLTWTPLKIFGGGWQGKSLEMDVTYIQCMSFFTWNNIPSSFLQMLISTMPKWIFEVIHNDSHGTHCWDILLSIFYSV